MCKGVKQSLFSYDRNLYYIKKDSIYYGDDDEQEEYNNEEDDEDDVDIFLKNRHNYILSFTYNIDTTLNLHQQEMFS